MAATVARQKSSLYDRDRQVWLKRQEELATAGRASELDLAHIAEELRDMGASERRELRSRLITLLVHLLKYEFQPQARSPSWLGTIAEQRTSIGDLLRDSPSLRNHLAQSFAEARTYRDAVRRAALESRLDGASFPASYPHPLDRVLDDEFWPGVGPHPSIVSGQ
jgi:hypothetical protein